MCPCIYSSEQAYHNLNTISSELATMYILKICKLQTHTYNVLNMYLMLRKHADKLLLVYPM